MADIKTINGTDIVIKFGDAGSEVEVYCSTTCTLNITSATTGASCKSGGSWTQNIEGTRSWDVSVDGLYQNSDQNGFVDIADLIIDDTIPNDVTIVIGMEGVPPAGEPSNFYWTGKAVCTGSSLTAPDGEIATWSATFVGNGPLLKTEVEPPLP